MADLYISLEDYPLTNNYFLNLFLNGE